MTWKTLFHRIERGETCMSVNNKMRVNMYLPRGLVALLDMTASDIGCSRTEILTHILLNYFEQPLADLANNVKEIGEKATYNKKNNK